MAPAFSSRGQAAGFAVLLVALLGLPAVMHATGGLARKDVYPTCPVSTGPYAHIQREIFEAKAELDMAFVGSSFMRRGIDTPYVQHALSEALGRPARVVTLASNWPGEDRTCWFVNDLLQQRKVRQLVLAMPIRFQATDDPDFEVNRVTPNPYIQAYRLHRFGEDRRLTAGLDGKSQVALYAGAVAGMPRHLLSLLRPNLLNDPPGQPELGEDKVQRGYYNRKFVPFAPAVPGVPAEAMIYSPGSARNFKFTGDGLYPYQLHFVEKTFQLAHEHGVRLVILHIPEECERHATAVEERLDWTKMGGGSTALVGIPPATLFQGLSDDEIKLLYSSDHLNQNGNEFFTRAVTPALVKLCTQNADHP